MYLLVNILNTRISKVLLWYFNKSFPLTYYHSTPKSAYCRVLLTPGFCRKVGRLNTSTFSRKAPFKQNNSLRIWDVNIIYVITNPHGTFLHTHMLMYYLLSYVLGMVLSLFCWPLLWNITFRLLITKWIKNVITVSNLMWSMQCNEMDAFSNPLLAITSSSRTYRVSQEEWIKLRVSVPYVKLYRYNPKHLYPKLIGYGDNGQRKVWPSCSSTYCTFSAGAWLAWPWERNAFSYRYDLRSTSLAVPLDDSTSRTVKRHFIHWWGVFYPGRYK